MDEQDADIRVERDGDGIVTVVLNRPEVKNAIRDSSWARLREIFDDIAARPDDRAVVIKGAGGNFCSGADLRDQVEDISARRRMQIVHGACAAIRNLPKPTIAAVSGYAVGAGFNLALACDLAIADKSARFSQIFVKRGLSLDFGGTWSVTHALGLQRAKELAFFGRMYSAEEIFAMGALNRVVEDGGAEALAAEWARELAQLPPTTLSITKEQLNLAVSSTFEESLLRESTYQNFMITTEDTREALTAFAERREPKFTGR